MSVLTPSVTKKINEYARAEMVAYAEKAIHKKTSRSAKADIKKTKAASKNAIIALDKKLRSKESGYQGSWSTATANNANRAIAKAVKPHIKAAVKNWKSKNKASSISPSASQILAAVPFAAVTAAANNNGEAVLSRRALMTGLVATAATTAFFGSTNTAHASNSAIVGAASSTATTLAISISTSVAVGVGAGTRG